MSLAAVRDDTELRTWSDPHGRADCFRLRPGIGLMVFTGKLGDDAAVVWTEHLQWIAGDGSFTLFLDAEHLSLAGSSFISGGTGAVKANRARIDYMSGLVSSGLVEMVAKTANLALGGVIHVTRDRAQFEGAIDRALARADSRSLGH
jgi:hypothetical protein